MLEKAVKETRVEIKGFLSFCKKKRNRPLIISAVFFLILGICLAEVARGQVKKSLVEQMLHREQVIARSEARSIERFFESVARVVITESDCPMIETFGLAAQKRMLKIIGQWEGTAFTELGLIDSQGQVKYEVGWEEMLVRENPGVSVVDREYFIQAKSMKEDKIYIGDPIKARGGPFEGEYVVPLVAPIIKDGRFKGVLAGAVLLSQLIDDYLEPLVISERTEVHLINSENVIIGSSLADKIGNNLSKYIEGGVKEETRTKFEELVKEVEETDEGKAEVILESLDGSGKEERVLIAVSTVHLDRVFSGELPDWYVGVETPREDAMHFFGMFGTAIRIVITVLILMTLCFSVALVMTGRLVQEDSYLDGLTDGRKKSK